MDKERKDLWEGAIWSLIIMLASGVAALYFYNQYNEKLKASIILCVIILSIISLLSLLFLYGFSIALSKGLLKKIIIWTPLILLGYYIYSTSSKEVLKYILYSGIGFYLFYVFDKVSFERYKELRKKLEKIEGSFNDLATELYIIKEVKEDNENMKNMVNDLSKGLDVAIEEIVKVHKKFLQQEK